MQQARTSPQMRVLHASPGAPPVDVWVDGAPLIAGLAYAGLSTYIQLAPDRHDVRVFRAGTSDWPGQLAEIRLEKLEPGRSYALALVGEPKDVQGLLLLDSVPAPPPGRANIRVLHAVPDAPALDVAIRGAPPLFQLVPFAQVTPFKEVAADPVDLELRRSGHPEVVAVLEDYPLTGGRDHTLALIGLLGGQPSLEVVPIVWAVERCVPVC